MPIIVINPVILGGAQLRPIHEGVAFRLRHGLGMSANVLPRSVPTKSVKLVAEASGIHFFLVLRNLIFDCPIEIERKIV